MPVGLCSSLLVEGNLIYIIFNNTIINNYKIKEILLMNIDDVKNILFEVVDEINDESAPDRKLAKSLDTVLLGRQGKLDSMGLVRFIVATEQKLTEQVGVPLILTD